MVYEEQQKIPKTHIYFYYVPLTLCPPLTPLVMSKLVRIMLETWNLVRKYTSTQTYGKYTFQQQDLFNLANVSTFF